MDRRTLATTRLFAVACLSAVTSGQFRFLQTLKPRWTTEHHDARNSGMASIVGPGEVNGTCRNVIANSTVQGSFFTSSGVASTDDKRFYAGDSLNRLWLSDVEAFRSTLINLTSLGGPTHSAGVTSTPAVGTGAQGDRLYIGSTSGTLYALNPTYCTSQVDYDFALSVMEEVPSSGSYSLHRVNVPAFRAAAAATAGVSADAPCVAWMAQFPRPIMAPVRWSLYDTERHPSGIVLASETHALLDHNGVLHAIDAASGVEMWAHAAVFNGTTCGIRGVPALDTTRDDLVYLPYCSRLVALEIENGQLVAEVNTSVWEGTAADPFISSPTVLEDGSAVYIHSSLGTLWRINLAGEPMYTNTTVDPVPGFNFTVSGVNMTVAFACDYEPENPTQPCTPPPPSAAAAEQTFSLPVFDDDGSVLRYRTVRRGDMSSGGFPQPSTREDVAQLREAAAALYLAKLGPSAADPATLTLSHIIDALEPREVAGIVTPNGYRLLNSKGKPVRPADLADGSGIGGIGIGLYPFATPSIQPLLGLDNAIIVSQYRLGADSGLYSVNMTSGEVFWGFSTWVDPRSGYQISFGRSRSSPAIDINGNIYVGTDADNLLVTNDTTPLLFAFDPNGKVQWVENLGQLDKPVGASSPAITVGGANEKRAYMVAEEGVIALEEGKQCPYSNNPLLPCSGGGDCDCTTGSCKCDACHNGTACETVCGGHGTCGGDATCTCDTCWTSADGGLCNEPLDCGHGTCQPDGSCLCDPCWLPDVASGGACTKQNKCSNRGTCNNVTNMCECTSMCWSGPTCAVPNDCDGQGTCSEGAGCTCNSGYGPGGPDGCLPCDSCHSGVNCAVQQSCGQGVCISEGSSFTCMCNACYNTDASGQCTVLNTCNGNGQCSGGNCNCNSGYGPGGSGSCLPCDACSSGPNCAIVEKCGGHGICNSKTGQCNCSPHFDNKTKCTSCDLCHTGVVSGCTKVSMSCSGHGVCNVAAGGCVCDAGWSGPACLTEEIAPSNNNAGTVAAAVLVPLTLMGAGIGFFFAKGGSLAQIKAMMPSASSGKYSKLSTAGSAGSSAGSAGSATGAAPKSAASIIKTAGVGTDAALKAVSRLAGVKAGASASASAGGSGSGSGGSSAAKSSLLGSKSVGSYGAAS